MKKYILTIFVFLSVFVGAPAFAKDTATTSDDPRIIIELHNTDKLSDEWKEIKSDNDDDTIRIDVDESNIGGIIAFGLGFAFLFVCLALACFIFWVAMLVHAIKYPIPTKALWIIVIVLFGILGAIIYYFAVRQPYKKETHHAKHHS